MTEQDAGEQLAEDLDFATEAASLLLQLGYINLDYAAIAPTAAAQVLWLYADPQHGMQPGSFFQHLISAMQCADPDNLARLALVYPGMARAVHLARDVDDGTERLRAIAAPLRASSTST